MTPIFTKYMPRAELHARVKAMTHTRGQAVYVPFNESVPPLEIHTEAMRKLCARLHWRNCHFVAGETPDGFVFVPCDVVGKHTHGTPPTEEQSLALPMSHNGAAARIAEADFTETLAAAGVAPTLITQLTALGPVEVQQRWDAGHIQFSSDEAEAAFVKALVAWSATK